jgi:hypothetical protein
MIDIYIGNWSCHLIHTMNSSVSFRQSFSVCASYLHDNHGCKTCNIKFSSCTIARTYIGYDTIKTVCYDRCVNSWLNFNQLQQYAYIMHAIKIYIRYSIVHWLKKYGLSNSDPFAVITIYMWHSARCTNIVLVYVTCLLALPVDFILAEVKTACLYCTSLYGSYFKKIFYSNIPSSFMHSGCRYVHQYFACVVKQSRQRTVI